MTDHASVNRARWDELAPAHAASPDYGFDRFAADPAHLSDVVRFDRDRLGDVRGLRGVHLQCHIGTDTVSLARLGARMTGLDSSTASLQQARRLAGLAGVDLDLVAADVHDAVEVLGAESFDLVYTGVGALNWLPSVARWARVVAGLLRPGGRLHLREGHPAVLTVDDLRDGDDLLVVERDYSERTEPFRFDDGEGTYVATDVVFRNRTTHEWNHGLGETVTALLDAGMRLTALVEHDTVPWEALPGRMRPAGGGEWRLADRPRRLPLSYTLQAVRL